MPLERHSTVIDGHTYEMSLLGATQGYRLFHRLFKMFGPSFGALMDAMTDVKDVQDLDLSSDVVVSGIQALTNHVKEKDLDYVIDALRKQTHVSVAEGSDKTVPLSGVWESHFAGRIGSMFKWIGWGLRVQYSTFYDAFASMKPPGEGEASGAATARQ